MASIAPATLTSLAVEYNVRDYRVDLFSTLRAHVNLKDISLKEEENSLRDLLALELTDDELQLLARCKRVHGYGLAVLCTWAPSPVKLFRRLTAIRPFTDEDYQGILDPSHFENEAMCLSSLELAVQLGTNLFVHGHNTLAVSIMLGWKAAIKYILERAPALVRKVEDFKWNDWDYGPIFPHEALLFGNSSYLKKVIKTLADYSVPLGWTGRNPNQSFLDTVFKEYFSSPDKLELLRFLLITQMPCSKELAEELFIELLDTCHYPLLKPYILSPFPSQNHAVHLVAKYGNHTHVEWLIREGYPFLVTDGQNKLPSQIAAENERSDFATYLELVEEAERGQGKDPF